MTDRHAQIGHTKSTMTVQEKTSTSLWKLRLLWLCALGVLFSLSYQATNNYAASLPYVANIRFDWEQYIPLISWTIVPYWSIDLLYAAAFFLPKTRKELNTLGLRLLSAQIICCVLFVLFPLTFSVERPIVEGLFGELFRLLMLFDQPFNQAPSLHVVLAIILNRCYFQYLNRFSSPLMKTVRLVFIVWFALIALSVLTTWQHHFLDLPLGILAGVFILWCWPTHLKSPLSNLRWRYLVKDTLADASLLHQKKRAQIAFRYFSVSLSLLSLAIYFSGMCLILIWPSACFFLVALNYAVLGTLGFQKQDNGLFRLASIWLYAPYFLVLKLTAHFYSDQSDPANEVVKGIWVGRKPDQASILQYAGVLDMCAESPILIPQGIQYQQQARLDLIPVTPQQCWQAAQALDRLIKQTDAKGKVLVFCALGYSRSCTAVMAWLLIKGLAENPQQALEIMKKARPHCVIHDFHLEALDQMMDLLEISH